MLSANVHNYLKTAKQVRVQLELEGNTLETSTDTEKTVEIEANPRVELCYLDDGHNQVRLTGTAEIVTDRPLLEEIWAANPLMRQYLGSLDNPALIVYRIRPVQVRYMQEWALAYYEVPVS